MPTHPHVFIIQGDITHLACDAWLASTDRNVWLTTWRDSIADVDRRLAKTDLRAFRSEQTLAVPLATEDGEPVPIITAVPFAGVKRADDLRPAVQQFIQQGARVALARRDADPDRTPLRPLPLLAMPFFGTRGGGGGLRRGDILRVLLEEASEWGSLLGVDVALVLRDQRAYALAQHYRLRLPDPWRSLSGAERGEAERLAGLAREKRLVPFMGAGISVTAGAPTWKELIQRLAKDVSLTSDEEASLAARDPRDQAAFLRAAFERRPKGSDADGGYAQAIKRAVDVRRYGLAPALLASLQAEQAITLNYDCLFEIAAEDARLPRTVVPDGGASGGRWLLKLHGTVNDPKTIVLTRDDYLGYNAERAALSALVKATLLTRHLLFVGFGFSDDHFHEIVHDVRRALKGRKETSAMGTTLTLRDDPLDEAIWEPDLKFVKIGDGNDIVAGGRRVEIFLDLLLALANDSHSYLLSDGFEDGLLDEEKTLRQRLLKLISETSVGERRSRAWAVLDDALAELGFRETPRR